MMDSEKFVKRMKDWYRDLFLYDEKDERMERKRTISLNQTIKALEDHIVEQKGKIAETRGKIELLEKYSGRKPPYNDGAIEEILSLTCYKSPAYCCSLEKPCVWRDSALNLLGISAKEYERMKKEFHDKIMDGKVVANGSKKKNGH
jgi:hypothetical protein